MVTPCSPYCLVVHQCSPLSFWPRLGWRLMRQDWCHSRSCHRWSGRFPSAPKLLGSCGELDIFDATCDERNMFSWDVGHMLFFWWSLVMMFFSTIDIFDFICYCRRWGNIYTHVKLVYGVLVLFCPALKVLHHQRCVKPWQKSGTSPYQLVQSIFTSTVSRRHMFFWPRVYLHCSVLINHDTDRVCCDCCEE